MKASLTKPRQSRLRGLALLVLGLICMWAPVFVGDWAFFLGGLALIAAGAVQLIQAFYSKDKQIGWAAYIGGGISALLGILLLFGPELALSGLFAVLAGTFAVEGVVTVWAALRGEPKYGRSRLWMILSGLLSVAIAIGVWAIRRTGTSGVAGFAVGLYCIVSAWSMLFAPEEGVEDVSVAKASNEHPDSALGLPPHPEFGRLRADAIDAEKLRRPIDIFWVSSLIAIFFAIHFGRMQMTWTGIGLVSPLIATLGDIAYAVLVSILLVLPARLLVRKLTRSIERRGWYSILDHDPAAKQTVGEKVLRYWLDERLRFAVRMRMCRSSLNNTLWALLQIGLPLTAVLVAVNPIWGFSWYFNTENWASGFWQEVTAKRTDDWREAMIEAVQKAYLAKGITGPAVVEVKPEGVNEGDFSFVVIGDPGEGDPSQHILRDRYLNIGERADVKFFVISSDIIYPDGAAHDYEFKFYLPYKGVTKPIYAIPGNHDWFNANTAFNSHFLEPDAARAANRARMEKDLRLTSTTEARVESLIRDAADLRREYQVQTGKQRAPFFDIQSPKFALICADTGILRRLDKLEEAWFRAALDRSRGKFIMVLLGHPLYTMGAYQGTGDEEFARIHKLLRDYKVPLVMAGDTHNFEYYKELYGPGAEMHHFVNGGGGAYLSIGPALDWPAVPPTSDFGIYPSGSAVRAKLDRQTPAWKWPAWWWVKTLRAWPASVETLSAVFDFNQAPFFQSFMEIRVEPSASRVRLLLHGANGQLRWGDLDRGGSVAALDRDAPVEWSLPMGLR